MGDVRYIIDRRGLPHAVGYYHTFPHEPSPAGELALEQRFETLLDPMTAFTLLDALVAAGTGATVLVVCHGVPDGLLVPIDTGSSPLTRDAVDVIEGSASGLDRATAIRAMPEGTNAEKQSKKNDWSALNERLGMGLVGDWSLQEADAQFERWMTSQGSRIRLSGARLKQLIGKMRAVQALKLDRLELRACDLGKNALAMAAIKRFFGCKKLLAPRCRTFYLEPITVESIAPLTAAPAPAPSSMLQMPADTWQPHRLPPRAGAPLIPNPTSGDLSVAGRTVTGKRRRFFNTRSYLVIGIWEVDQFVFRAAAAAPRAANAPTSGRGSTWTSAPDWSQVSEVVRSLFMFGGGNYGGREFPIAGLWDPPASMFPWLVPNEKEYVSLIVTA
jgi:hypothetical protein